MAAAVTDAGPRDSRAAIAAAGASSPAAAPSRQRWNNPMEFTITCIGYAVGLGNFWRFPYYCYTYGGGAFLVPYTLVLVIIGIPLFLLELGIGQKSQVGATQAWKNIHPALGGVGYSGVTATFLVALYYNVLVAWALWFLFNSFQSPLPWADESLTSASNTSTHNASKGAVHEWEPRALSFFEVDTLHCRGNRSTCSWADITSWEGVYPSLFSPGGLVAPLVGCLALGWFLIWLCVCQGIESLGRVAWFTAIFPYIVLVIMLVRGLTLPGASIGLRFYLEPDFSKLSDPMMWIAAGSQIFYSTGVGWGTLVAFASYNDHSHNFVRDAWMVPLINCATSFLAGLVVFSVLGFMAQSAGVEVGQLHLQGTGLAFVAYPQAISQMPGAPVFAVLFFLMVLCLGVDSQFAMVETVLTTLNDAGAMPRLSKPQKSAVVCTAMGLFGLIFVTRAGSHWLELFDIFAVNFTLFVCGGLESVAVGWVYGGHRFAADTASMTGRVVPRQLLFSYKWIIPTLLAILALTTLVLSVQAAYDFPTEGLVFGWLLTSCSISPLVYFAARHFCRRRSGGRLAGWWPRLRARLPPRSSSAAAAPRANGLPREHLSGVVLAMDDGSAAKPIDAAPVASVAGAGGTPQRPAAAVPTSAHGRPPV